MYDRRRNGAEEPVGLRMIRLQRWESGPYFTAFSLHIPDMLSFFNLHEIAKICPRSPTYLSNRCFAFEHLSPTGAYSPATVIDSIRIDPVWRDVRASASSATATIDLNMSFRFPATVISSTG
jgi:hypothetical protein